MLNFIHLKTKIEMKSRSSTIEVTELLKAWSNGDESALEELTPHIYGQLYKIAARCMRQERGGHVLQTTALVNEAFVRLIDWETADFNNRAHFYGVSAQLMRRILVDFARKRPRIGGVEVQQISIAEAMGTSGGQEADVVALHEALEELEKFDARKARIVELKFFGGLKVEEIADFLEIAPVTVMRDWKTAKAWLFRELSNDT